MKTIFTTAAFLWICGWANGQLPEKHLIMPTHSGSFLGLTSADFNNDGVQDYLFWNDFQFIWNECNGDSVWSASHVISTNYEVPSKVCIADINSDGAPDIFYLYSSYPRAAAWLENPGDGTGNWTQHTIANHYNWLIGVFDVDDDTDPDFVYESSAGALGYYENIGGVFSTTHSIPDSYPAINSSACTDFDKDGDSDFVLYFYDCCIKYFKNNHDGSFAVSTISTSEYQDDIYTGDTNSDGYSDIVYHYGSNYYVATFNSVTASFNPYYLFGSITCDQFRITDMDGDGDDDWALFTEAAYDGGYYDLKWIENPGTIVPATATLVMDSVPSHYDIYEFSDYNQDGINDLFTTDNFSLKINYALNSTPVYGSAFSPENTVLRFDLASVFDVNNDGTDDILLANHDGVVGWVQFDVAADSLIKYRILPNMDGGPLPICMKENDLDNDGDQDFVVSFHSGGTYTQVSYYFINDGTGKFTMHEFSDIASRKIWFSDVDNDGDNDMIGMEDDIYKKLRLYINSGDTANLFATSMLISTAAAIDYDMIDVDGDGDDDFVGTFSGYSAVRKIINNNADATFVPAATLFTTTCIYPETVYADDIDADGDPDYLYACSTGDFYRALNTGGTYSNLHVGFFNNEVPVAPSYDSKTDINNDGFTDAMISNYTSGTFTKVSTGPGAYFEDAVQISSDYGIAVDLDQDGSTDFIGMNSSELYIQYSILESIPDINITAPTATWIAEGETPDSIVIFANIIPESPLVINIDPESLIDAGNGAGEIITVTLAADSTSLLPHTVYFSVPDDVSVEDIATSHVHITADPATWGTFDYMVDITNTYTITDNDLGFFRSVATVMAPESGTPVNFTAHFNRVCDVPVTVTLDPDADFSIGYGMGVAHDVVLSAGIGSVNTFTISVYNLNDAIDEDMITEYLHFSFSSADPLVDAFTTPSEMVTLEDNDVAGFTRTSPGATHYTEGVEYFHITLGLTTAPVADVNILAVPDAQLDLGNGWGIPVLLNYASTGVIPPTQTIDGVPVDEHIVEVIQSGVISFTVTSDDPKYAAETLSDVLVHIDDATATAITEGDQLPLTVFPSAGNGNFTLQTSGLASDSKLVVFNTAGQVVFSDGLITGNNYTLDLTDMAAGNYIVAVYNSTGSGTARLQVIK